MSAISVSTTVMALYLQCVCQTAWVGPGLVCNLGIDGLWPPCGAVLVVFADGAWIRIRQVESEIVGGRVGDFGCA